MASLTPENTAITFHPKYKESCLDYQQVYQFLSIKIWDRLESRNLYFLMINQILIISMYTLTHIIQQSASWIGIYFQEEAVHYSDIFVFGKINICILKSNLQCCHLCTTFLLYRNRSMHPPTTWTWSCPRRWLLYLYKKEVTNCHMQWLWQDKSIHW